MLASVKLCSLDTDLINSIMSYFWLQDFRKGMNIYLTRHQYSSACTEDLWQALEEASSKPVTSVMRTWTLQKGFPVLKVDFASLQSPGHRHSLPPHISVFFLPSKKSLAHSVLLLNLSHHILSNIPIDIAPLVQHTAK